MTAHDRVFTCAMDRLPRLALFLFSLLTARRLQRAHRGALDHRNRDRGVGTISPRSWRCFLAAISWRRGRLGVITAMIALAAALLCLLPSLRAAEIARTLPARCNFGFRRSDKSEGPSSFHST